MVTSGCTMEGNRAATLGGAVQVGTGGHLLMNDSFGTFNMAGFGGGGISFDEQSTGTLSRCVLVNNKIVAPFTGGAFGGTVAVINAKVSIENCTLVNTIAQPAAHSGGIIYAEGVDSSSTTSSASAGGGSTRGRLGITDTVLMGARAARGGALMAHGIQIDLIRSAIRGAQASEFGGAIFASTSATIFVQDSQVMLSSSTFDGGGAFVRSGATLWAVRSAFVGNSGDLGGSVYVDTFSKAVFRECIVRASVAGFLGGGVYVHRLAALNMNMSRVYGNVATSSGGGLFITDSIDVSIDSTVVDGNGANSRGGGMVIQQRSHALLSSVIVAGNSAPQGGGVVVASDSVVSMVSTSVASNFASGAGGGISLDGSGSEGRALLTLRSTAFVGNVAGDVGGAMSVRDGSSANVSGTLFRSNEAASGAALAVQEVCTLHIEGSVLSNNTAMNSGAAFYFHGIPTGAVATQVASSVPITADGVRRLAEDTRSVQWSNLWIANNVAVSGGGMFWSLPLPFDAGAAPLPTATCTACRFSNNTGDDVATSAVGFESGAVRAVEVASGMTFGDYIQVQSARPYGALVDALGRPTKLDNKTVCNVMLLNASDNTAWIAPLTVQARLGQLEYDMHAVRANADAVMQVVTTCTLTSPLRGSETLSTAFSVTINRCLPGWDLGSDRVCRRCLPGSYSPLGLLCKPCPSNALCSQTLASSGAELLVGVERPLEEEGFWLGPARASMLEGPGCTSLLASRKHPETGQVACFIGQEAVLHNDGLLECTKMLGVDVDVLFACVTQTELYSCPSPDACMGGSDLPHAIAIQEPTDAWPYKLERRLSVNEGSVHAFSANATCRPGHTGIMCSQCAPGFTMNKQLLCDVCPDTPLGLYVLGAATVVGIVALYSYVDGGDAEDGLEDDGQTWMTWVQGKCQQCCRKAARKRKRARERTVKPRTPTLKMYLQYFFKGVMEQPDKMLLLMSFMQMVGQFGGTYNVAWPEEVTSLFQVGAAFNLDVSSVTSVNCYRLSVINYYNEVTLYIIFPPCVALFVYTITKNRVHKVNKEIKVLGLKQCVWETIKQKGTSNFLAAASKRVRAQKSKRKKRLGRLVSSVGRGIKTSGLAKRLKALRSRKRFKNVSKLVGSGLFRAGKTGSKTAPSVATGATGVVMHLSDAVSPKSSGIKLVPGKRRSSRKRRGSDGRSIPASRQRKSSVAFAKTTELLTPQRGSKASKASKASLARAPSTTTGLKLRVPTPPVVAPQEERKMSMMQSAMTSLTAPRVQRRGSAVLAPMQAQGKPKKRGSLSALKPKKLLGSLRGKMKLMRATKLVRMATKLDNRIDFRRDAPLKLWFEWHRRGATEAGLLGDGQTVCTCIHPCPNVEYEPEKLCARGKLHWRVFQTRNRAIVTFFTILLFIYLPVSSKLLAFFLCEEVGDAYRLQIDRSFRCLTPAWWKLFPLALLGVVLFVLSVPVFALTLVNRARKQHASEYLELLLTPYDIAAVKYSTDGRSWLRKVLDKVCCRNRALRAKNLQEMRDFQWRQASKAVGSSVEDSLPNGIKYEEVKTKYDAMNAEEFAKAKAVAVEDERQLGWVPTVDEKELVRQHLYRLNLRAYHTASKYGSVYDSFLEKAWWYEGVMFAEKITLNGLAAFITQSAAQMTFAILMSGLLVMVQVHVNPYTEHDLGRLANLLVVSLFLLLLVGAYIELMGDDEWTTSSLAVQNAIVAAAAVCVSLGVLLIVRDTVREMLEMRAKYIKAWEKEYGKMDIDDKPNTALSILNAFAGNSAASPAPAKPSAEVKAAKQVEAAEAATAVRWVLAQVQPGQGELPELAARALRRELTRSFGRLMVGRYTVEELEREYARGSSESKKKEPTLPPFKLLGKAKECVAVVQAHMSHTLPSLPVSMEDLMEQSLIEGNKRLSVMVGEPGERMYLSLHDDGIMTTHMGTNYKSPTELYLDTKAFGARRMHLIQGHPGESVWYHPVCGNASGAHTLLSICTSLPAARGAGPAPNARESSLGFGVAAVVSATNTLPSWRRLQQHAHPSHAEAPTHAPRSQLRLDNMQRMLAVVSGLNLSSVQVNTPASATQQPMSSAEKRLAMRRDASFRSTGSIYSDVGNSDSSAGDTDGGHWEEFDDDDNNGGGGGGDYGFDVGGDMGESLNAGPHGGPGSGVAPIGNVSWG